MTAKEFIDIAEKGLEENKAYMFIKIAPPAGANITDARVEVIPQSLIEVTVSNYLIKADSDLRLIIECETITDALCTNNLNELSWFIKRVK